MRRTDYSFVIFEGRPLRQYDSQDRCGCLESAAIRHDDELRRRRPTEIGAGARDAPGHLVLAGLDERDPFTGL
jgi:hypothetical protein